MSVDVKSLPSFVDKKVVVVHTVDGQADAVETEGTVQGANPGGILLKPKGKTQFILLEPGQIEDIRYVEESAKPLKRKVLKVVEFGQARTHLLERHGLKLAEVNKLSEKEAFERHNGIDHEKEDLGHVHGDKEKTSASESSDDSE